MAWNSLPDVIRDPTSSTDFLGVYLTRASSRVTSASSALAVLYDYALYKSTHSSGPKEDCYQFRCLVNRGTMGVNSLPKTVTRQRRGCDLNPGPRAPESSTLTTRLPSHATTAASGPHTHTHPFNQWRINHDAMAWGPPLKGAPRAAV